MATCLLVNTHITIMVIEIKYDDDDESAQHCFLINSTEKPFVYYVV